MTFDPSQTISARVKRRIVKDWRSRLRDWSTIFVSAGFIWEVIVKPAYGADLPAVLVAELTKALFVLAGVSKFIRQGVPKE